MERTATRYSGVRWRLAAAALSPFVLTSAYLFLSRWPSYRFTVLSDYVGLGLPVLVGAVFIAILPLRAHVRILSVVIYVPVISALLVYFALWFIAVVFHDAL